MRTFPAFCVLLGASILPLTLFAQPAPPPAPGTPPAATPTTPVVSNTTPPAAPGAPAGTAPAPAASAGGTTLATSGAAGAPATVSNKPTSTTQPPTTSSDAALNAGLAPGTKATQTAAASQPSVPSSRNGTLGIPPTSDTGVSALVTNTFGQGQYNLNFLAQIGKLQLNDVFSLDVVGETTQVDLPIASYNPTLVPPQRPLPTLQQVSLDSVGARLRWRFTHNHTKAEVSECLSQRDLAKDNKSRSCAVPELNDPTAWSARPITAIAADELRSLMSGWDLVGGGRVLYQPPAGADAPANAVGGAAELALQNTSSWGGGFFSISGLSIGGSSKTTAGVVTREEVLRELRFALGANWQFNLVAGADQSGVGGAQILPNVGAYVAYSRNFWENPFFAPGMDHAVSGDRLEFVLYGSGHFSGGFSGLLSVSISKPYGPDWSNWQTIVSIAPSVGASTKTSQ